jgi:hypothetical protein
MCLRLQVLKESRVEKADEKLKQRDRKSKRMKFFDCPKTLSSEKVLGLKAEVQGVLVKLKLVGKKIGLGGEESL